MEVTTLRSLSLSEICYSMNAQRLQLVLNTCPNSIVFEIIWKVLYVNNGMDFAFNHLDSKSVQSAINRGQRFNIIIPTPNNSRFSPAFRNRINSEQIAFIKKDYFFDLFDVDLFFRLVNIEKHRNRLYTLFHVCIVYKGLDFPEKFAEQWLQKESPEDIDNDFYFNRIEEGLLLGVFLGDTGWYIECALVLSHTYNIITTKWVCLDRNLVQKKTSECLAKWLIVLSENYNFDQAQRVLHLVLNIISDVQITEDNNYDLPYLKVSVSFYYFVILELHEAWKWVMDATENLNDTSKDNLRHLILNHKIRVASSFNKEKVALECVKLTYADQQLVSDIDENIYADIYANKGCFLLSSSSRSSYEYHYIVLDIRRNRFGFFNILTANAFIHFANTRFYFNDLNSTNIIEMGIYILQEIGVPYDNPLMLNAKRIKAKLMEKESSIHLHLSSYVNATYLNSYNGEYRIIKKIILNSAKHIYLFVLRTFLRTLGQNSLHTARAYCNLAYLYIQTENYEKSEQLILKTIEINDSILGPDNLGLMTLLNTLIYFDTNLKINPDGAELHRERLTNLRQICQVEHDPNYFDYFGFSSVISGGI